MSNSPRPSIPVYELPLDPEAIRKSFVQQVQYNQGKHPSAATRLDHFMSLARKRTLAFSRVRLSGNAFNISLPTLSIQWRRFKWST